MFGEFGLEIKPPSVNQRFKPGLMSERHQAYIPQAGL